MAISMKMTCLECGTVNRVPSDKLGAGPKCGTCGARMTDGKVRSLDPKILQKAAKTDDVPLLVDFWAPWCGPCKMMAPEFQKAAQTLAPNARLAKINTQDHPVAADRYNIKGIPALILFQKGRAVGHLAGARPAGEIESFVRQKAKMPA